VTQLESESGLGAGQGIEGIPVTVAGSSAAEIDQSELKPVDTTNQNPTIGMPGSVIPGVMSPNTVSGNMSASNASRNQANLSQGGGLSQKASAINLDQSKSRGNFMDTSLDPLGGSNNVIEDLLSVRMNQGPDSLSTQESMNMANLDQQENALGFLDSGSQDPFADLGSVMNEFNVQTTQFDNGQVGRSMSGMEEQLFATGFKITESKMADQSLKTSDILADREMSQAENLDLRADQSNASSELGMFKPDIANLDQTLNGASLQAGLSGENSNGSSQFGGSQFDQSGFEESRKDLGDSLSQPLNAASFSTSATKQEAFVSGLQEGSLTQASASELKSKIMQQTTLLLKDGGGSMRMDFNTPGMGKIDLAINLNNNQLDVRILTPNEQTRDMINKELSGLRDGLGQRGIALRHVEIGNASQASQHFGSGNFAQEQQRQQASYNDMKEYSKSFTNSFANRDAGLTRTSVPEIRRQIPSGWMNSARDSSRIAVRI
jgi:hypothetical protein